MRTRSFEITDRLEMGRYEPTSDESRPGFLTAGVMNSTNNASSLSVVCVSVSDIC